MDDEQLIAGWKTKQLVEVTNLITCGVAKRPSYVDDGVPFLSARNIKNGEIIWSNYRNVTQDTHTELTKNNKPLIGDILYTRVGSFGEAAIIDKNIELSIFVSLTLIKPKRDILNTFLKYYLNSSFVKELAKKSISSSGVGNLNVGTVRKFPVPLPPLPEQKRIVAILDEAFAGISLAVANAEKNRANARELFESYLNNVFTQKEEEWKEKKLGDFTQSISTGPFGSLLHKSDYVTEGVPLVNPINLINGEIIPDSSKLIDKSTKKRLSNYILNAGDIVVGRRGEIGRCAVVGSEQSGWICGTGCFFIRPLADVNPEFLSHLLRSQTYKKNLESVATGATMKNISNKALSNLIVRLPTIEVQVGILNQISSLELLSQQLDFIYQQKLTALNELKQSILQKAFAGELTRDCDNE